MNSFVSVNLEDGSLCVPKPFVDAIGEEYEARGGRLNVAEAQVLIEKWSKESGA